MATAAFFPSYLTRARALAMIAGGAAAAGSYWLAQEDLWKSARELSATLPGTSPEPLREKIEGVEEVAAPERADAAATNRDRDLALGNWNRTVELAFGKAIASLSQRGLCPHCHGRAQENE